MQDFFKGLFFDCNSELDTSEYQDLLQATIYAITQLRNHSKKYYFTNKKRKIHNLQLI